MKKVLLKYRLFNVGKIIFFQILEQDERLRCNGDDNFKHKYICDLGNITIHSEVCPEVVDHGDHNKHRILVFLRGESGEDDNRVCKVKLYEEPDCYLVEHIDLAIIEYVKKYCGDISYDSNSASVTIMEK